jgi:hypothetical protein
MLAKIRMSKSFLLSFCPINIQNGGNQFWMNQGVRKRQFRKSVSLTFELPENNGHKYFQIIQISSAAAPPSGENFQYGELFH